MFVSCWGRARPQSGILAGAALQDPAAADKLTKIQRDLDETKIILHKTIESVLDRGEKLDQVSITLLLHFAAATLHYCHTSLLLHVEAAAPAGTRPVVLQLLAGAVKGGRGARRVAAGEMGSLQPCD